MVPSRQCSGRALLRRCCLALILSALALAHSPAALGKPKGKNKREGVATIAYYSAIARGTTTKSITALAIAESVQFQLTVGGSASPPYNVSLYRNPSLLPPTDATDRPAQEGQVLAGSSGTEWLKVVPTVWETYGTVLWEDGTDTMAKELAPPGRPQLVGEYTVETLAPSGFSDEKPAVATASLERGNAKRFSNPGRLGVPLENPLFGAALVDAMTGGAYVNVAFENNQYNLSFVVAIVDPEEAPLAPLLRIYNDSHAMPPLPLNCARGRWASPRMGLFTCIGYLTVDVAAGLQYPPGYEPSADAGAGGGGGSGGGGGEKKGGNVKFLPGVIGIDFGNGRGKNNGGGGGGALGGAFAAIGKKLGGLKGGGKKGGSAGKGGKGGSQNQPQTKVASASSLNTASLSGSAAAVQSKQTSGTTLSSQLKDKVGVAADSLKNLAKKGGKKGGKGGKGGKGSGDSSNQKGGSKTSGADSVAGPDTGTGAGGAGEGTGDDSGRAEMPYMEAMACMLEYGTSGSDYSNYYELSVFGASQLVGSSQSLEPTINMF
ncbi:hypothetical protein CLOM_g21871 [Closterium sp. NIES-68]|nr:hypothetical protein CLOM_g21871 [Closterium sp. NIES-68]GJP66479.1 hypothetical protein CLOP_g23408 [Closterium sp. NIES-67]